ncbi:beta-lactamase family protein [Komagataeibacter sp. AV436]|uniref:Beta-lactamase family protein n=1 Tax=Komagataeibacter melomenusus TaxID=2766578 RepID=A0ABX2ACG5_9PROT|nr:serine hydrolase domain-containing protein [Komagataeibacter melomenusus]MBV1830447.1 beta-lactamase family protein [Komagataeibacter melomenusus]NPC66044.1 beta-lactamase family protein [Komagataeibacter melomenusus]
MMAGGLALGLSACAARARSDARMPMPGVDARLRRAVSQHETPGVVCAVGHAGAVVHRAVYGLRALIPRHEAMTWDTMFDMASLTKALITAPAIMQLWERGLVGLDVPVCHYLPEFAANAKSAITIRHLLTHYSGLPPDLDLTSPWQGAAEGRKLTLNARPDHPPGQGFVYSDINYLALGFVVEKLTGQPLATYATDTILRPMGLAQSCFLPPPALVPRIAPTQMDETGHMLRGVVHDPTTRRMGGVAGHAGLFSTAGDLCRYAQALLDRRAGRPGTPFPLRQDTVVLMTTPQQPAGKTDLRGLGWDIATHYSSARGGRFPAGSFGHTGFTGTSVWIDPQSDSYVLILTNRVHPDGRGNVVALRRDVATAAATALLDG